MQYLTQECIGLNGDLQTRHSGLLCRGLRGLRVEGRRVEHSCLPEESKDSYIKAFGPKDHTI